MAIAVVTFSLVGRPQIRGNKNSKKLKYISWSKNVIESNHENKSETTPIWTIYHTYKTMCVLIYHANHLGQAENEVKFSSLRAEKLSEASRCMPPPTTLYHYRLGYYVLHIS